MTVQGGGSERSGICPIDNRRMLFVCVNLVQSSAFSEWKLFGLLSWIDARVCVCMRERGPTASA